MLKRQPKNLRQMLMSSYFTFDKELPQVKTCGDKKCGLCKRGCMYSKAGKEFSFSGSSKPFRVKHAMDYEVSNVIYVITCCGCGEQYLGETEDTLQHRMTVHRQQI